MYAFLLLPLTISFRAVIMIDKDTFFHKKRLIRIKGKYWDFAIPRVMGILNQTPDSFYDGGRFLDPGAMMSQVDRLLDEGADILDIGCYSSRPGAAFVDLDEELSRLSRALGPIRKQYPDSILSVDTFRSAVAQRAVEEYAVDIINDISAGMLDPKMADIIASLQVPYIMMHMQGSPQNMQSLTDYKDLIKEVITFLGMQAEVFKQRGVMDIIIDPGFGFSKTLDQNYQLLSHLDTFKILEYPLLVGISRKSMIYKLLEITPDESLNGTTALQMLALEKGADILRVHDVKEAKQAVRLFLKTKEEGEKYRKQ
jgi:dihydropteroate synthase